MWHDNRLPPIVTVICLSLLIAVTVMRLALSRVSAMDRQINQLAYFGLASALVREPAVAHVLDRWIPAPLLFDLWHWLFVMFCVACLGIILLGELGPEAYRRPYRFWFGVGIAVGLAFPVLSHRARSEGLNVVDGHGWEFGAYFVLYCILPVSICVYGFRGFLRLRSQVTSWRERVGTIAVFLVALGGAINMTVLAVGAVMDSAGVHDGFTSETEVRASGELILPFLTLLFLAAIPASMTKVAELFRIDTVSGEDRALVSAWRNLTELAPQVVLPVGTLAALTQPASERLHRRRVELHDSANIVSSHITDDDRERASTALNAEGHTADVESSEAWLSALTLAAATQRLADLPRIGAGGPSADVIDVEEIARLWPQALDALATTAVPRQTGSSSALQ